MAFSRSVMSRVTLSVSLRRAPGGSSTASSAREISSAGRKPDGSSFVAMLWSQGVTEPGSSGSGLFTLNASQNYYELRGALFPAAVEHVLRVVLTVRGPVD